MAPAVRQAMVILAAAQREILDAQREMLALRQAADGRLASAANAEAVQRCAERVVGFERNALGLLQSAAHDLLAVIATLHGGGLAAHPPDHAQPRAAVVPTAAAAACETASISVGTGGAEAPRQLVATLAEVEQLLADRTAADASAAASRALFRWMVLAQKRQRQQHAAHLATLQRLSVLVEQQTEVMVVQAQQAKHRAAEVLASCTSRGLAQTHFGRWQQWAAAASHGRYTGSLEGHLQGLKQASDESVAVERRRFVALRALSQWRLAVAAQQLARSQDHSSAIEAASSASASDVSLAIVALKHQQHDELTKLHRTVRLVSAQRDALEQEARRAHSDLDELTQELQKEMAERDSIAATLRIEFDGREALFTEHIQQLERQVASMAPTAAAERRLLHQTIGQVFLPFLSSFVDTATSVFHHHLVRRTGAFAVAVREAVVEAQELQGATMRCLLDEQQTQLMLLQQQQGPATAAAIAADLFASSLSASLHSQSGQLSPHANRPPAIYHGRGLSGSHGRTSTTPPDGASAGEFGSVRLLDTHHHYSPLTAAREDISQAAMDSDTTTTTTTTTATTVTAGAVGVLRPSGGCSRRAVASALRRVVKGRMARQALWLWRAFTAHRSLRRRIAALEADRQGLLADTIEAREMSLVALDEQFTDVHQKLQQAINENRTLRDSTSSVVLGGGGGSPGGSFYGTPSGVHHFQQQQHHHHRLSVSQRLDLSGSMFQPAALLLVQHQQSHVFLEEAAAASSADVQERQERSRSNSDVQPNAGTVSSTPADILSTPQQQPDDSTGQSVDGDDAGTGNVNDADAHSDGDGDEHLLANADGRVGDARQHADHPGPPAAVPMAEEDYDAALRRTDALEQALSQRDAENASLRHEGATVRLRCEHLVAAVKRCDTRIQALQGELGMCRENEVQLEELLERYDVQQEQVTVRSGFFRQTACMALAARQQQGEQLASLEQGTSRLKAEVLAGKQLSAGILARAADLGSIFHGVWLVAGAFNRWKRFAMLSNVRLVVDDAIVEERRRVTDNLRGAFSTQLQRLEAQHAQQVQQRSREQRAALETELTRARQDERAVQAAQHDSVRRTATRESHLALATTQLQLLRVGHQAVALCAGNAFHTWLAVLCGRRMYTTMQGLAHYTTTVLHVAGSHLHDCFHTSIALAFHKFSLYQHQLKLGHQAAMKGVQEALRVQGEAHTQTKGELAKAKEALDFAEKLVGKYGAEIDHKWTPQVESLAAKLQTAEGEVARLQLAEAERWTPAVSQLTADLAAAQLAAAEATDTLRRETDTKWKPLVAQVTEEKQDALQRSDEAMATLRLDHQEQLQHLEEQHCTQLAALEQLSSAKMAESAETTERRMAELVATADHQAEALRARLLDLQREKARAVDATDALQHAIDATWQPRVAALTSELQSASRRSEAHAIALHSQYQAQRREDETMRLDLHAKLQDATRQASSAQQRCIVEAVEAAAHSHRRETDGLHAEYRAMLVHLEEESHGHQQALACAAASHSRMLAGRDQRHALAIDALQLAKDTELSTVSEGHAEALRFVADKYDTLLLEAQTSAQAALLAATQESSGKDAAMQELVAYQTFLEEKVLAAEAELLASVETLKREGVEERSRLQAAHQQEVAALAERHAQALQQLQRKADQELKAVEARIASLELSIQETTSTSQRQADTHRAQLVQEREQALHDKQASAAEHAQTLNQTKLELCAELRRLKANHTATTDEQERAAELQIAGADRLIAEHADRSSMALQAAENAHRSHVAALHLAHVQALEKLAHDHETALVDYTRRQQSVLTTQMAERERMHTELAAQHSHDLAAAQEASQRKDTEARQLRGEIARLSTELHDAVLRAAQRASQTAQQVQDELAAATAMHQAAMRALEAAHRQEMADGRDAHRASLAALEQATTEALQTLQSTIAQLEADKRALSAQADTHRETAQTAQEELQRVQTAASADDTAKHAALHWQVDALQTEKATLLASHRRSIQQLEEEQQHAAAKAANEIAAAKRETVDTYESTIRNLRGDIAALQREVEQSSLEKANITAQYEARLVLARGDEIAALEATIQTLRAEAAARQTVAVEETLKTKRADERHDVTVRAMRLDHDALVDRLRQAHADDRAAQETQLRRAQSDATAAHRSSIDSLDQEHQLKLAALSQQVVALTAQLRTARDAADLATAAKNSASSSVSAARERSHATRAASVVVPLLQRPRLLSWFHRWRREVTNRQFRADYEAVADREERASAQLRLLVAKLAERQQSALQAVGQHALVYGSRSSSQSSTTAAAAGAATFTTISTTTTSHHHHQQQQQQQQQRVLLASHDTAGVHHAVATLAFASTTPCSIARDGEESPVMDMMDSAPGTPRSHADPLHADPPGTTSGTSLSFLQEAQLVGGSMATPRQLVQLQEQRSLPRSGSRSGGSSPLQGADVNVVMAQQPLSPSRLFFHAAGGSSPAGAASPGAAGSLPASDGRKAVPANQPSPQRPSTPPLPLMPVQVPLTAQAQPPSAAVDDIDQLVLRGQQLLGRMTSAMAAQPILTASGPAPPVIRPLANGPIRTVLRSHALTSMVGPSSTGSNNGVLGQSPKRRLPRREF